jgi:SAM-dependent methyltransferase
MERTESSPSPRRAASDAGAAGAVCCSETWEEAYARFESPEEERRKFERRLHNLGADRWPRAARLVELFCGRGNGLHALARLGFTDLEGVDLSATLLGQYRGSARVRVADCRRLPYEDGSKDVLIVQGGLHHLPVLPDDLEQVLQEAARVLVPGGRFVVVEPWLTPFLRFVHAVTRSRLARRLSPRVDALAIMIRHEETTYNQWLSRPEEILSLLGKMFRAEYHTVAWGKLLFVGQKG